jgi:hypothetical protein
MVDEGGGGHRSDFIHKLREAQKKLVGKITLAALAADQAAGG